MLIAIRGEAGTVNRSLMFRAFDDTPSLILDCGNSADPHRIFHEIREERLHEVYVINAEAIYRFRDALRKLPYWKERLGLKQIAVTNIHALFSYDDEVENHNVLEHCWELMKALSGSCPVCVGIAQDSMHDLFARKYSDRIVEV